MAYDLFRHKQTPTNHSITLPPKHASTVERVLLGATAATMLYELLAKVKRDSEKQTYKRSYGEGLKTTVEMPAMPMRELQAIPYYDE
jgi:hypothetical protein